MSSTNTQEPVAWAAVHFGGRRDGKIYTTCDTRKQIEAYIQDVHQSSDSLTLRARPLAFADAPVAAQAQHDSCTDPENCNRCQAMPEHRGDMRHAGIGSYPTSSQAQPAVNGNTCTVPDDCETLHWRGQILSMNELASVAQPAVGEEIHVHVEGRDVLTLPLASSGMIAPRFVVHVPAQAQRDPRTPADMLVNGGALNLALNALRRAGKNEIADELVKTATRFDDGLSECQTAAGKAQQDADKDVLNKVLSELRAIAHTYDDHELRDKAKEAYEMTAAIYVARKEQT